LLPFSTARRAVPSPLRAFTRHEKGAAVRSPTRLRSTVRARLMRTVASSPTSPSLSTRQVVPLPASQP
jgi:hypothetical protein